jgi:transposase
MDQGVSPLAAHGAVLTSGTSRVVLQDYIDAVSDSEARIERLTKQIAGLMSGWSLAPVVEAIQAMRGVAFIVAVTVAAEVGDFQRFDTPRQLMAYLGLTPSEHSSGASVRRGGITKAGSGLARRALSEGAWSYRMQARVSPKLHARLEALPKAARDIAWKGQLRMCQRYRHLVAVGKAKVVVITAIAREMVGFIWAIARTVTAPPAGAATVPV